MVKYPYKRLSFCDSVPQINSSFFAISVIFLKMGKHSDFRISSFQVVDAWRILQFNRKTEKYLKEFIWFFFCRGEGATTRRLPCLRYGSHYLEVEICHWWTLLSANPKFS